MSLHAIVYGLFFHYLVFPLDRATFPTGSEFFHGSVLETRMEYRWESDTRLVSVHHYPDDGTSRNSVLILDGQSRALRDSVFGRDGRLILAGTYEYANGKLVAYRAPDVVSTLSYQGDNLDSIAVVSGDSLYEAYRFRYDAQNRLIQSDHWYDPDGTGPLEDKRNLVTYHLPDSIVIRSAFVTTKRDSGKRTIHLQDGKPIKMIQREWNSAATTLDTHTWTYAPNVSISPRQRRRKAGALVGLEGYSLLGRWLLP